MSWKRGSQFLIIIERNNSALLFTLLFNKMLAATAPRKMTIKPTKFDSADKKMHVSSLIVFVLLLIA